MVRRKLRAEPRAGYFFIYDIGQDFACTPLTQSVIVGIYSRGKKNYHYGLF